MTTETTCPYCDSSVYVRLDRDLLAGGEPFRFHGEWSPDEPEAWETFTLQVHGKEAADVADITVDDLVKIVRRGVESGEIEGFVEKIRPHFTHDGEWDWECVPVMGCPSDSEFLVIHLPASDRKEET